MVAARLSTWRLVTTSPVGVRMMPGASTTPSGPGIVRPTTTRPTTAQTAAGFRMGAGGMAAAAWGGARWPRPGGPGEEGLGVRGERQAAPGRREHHRRRVGAKAMAQPGVEGEEALVVLIAGGVGELDERDQCPGSVLVLRRPRRRR